MPPVSFDSQSLMIGAKRHWIVGCAIQYSMVPRADWADRLHATKLAGFNTVATSVFWNLHEPRQGQYDFDDENDLRAFVQLVGEAGLKCVLRVGPHVGEGMDMGGLPAWVTQLDDVSLRASNPAFLDAASRYLSAVAGQIADLQATAQTSPGPIVLVQTESAWTCGDVEGARYLSEIQRYLRESGIKVPTVNANNLWNSAEGEIDGWIGNDDLLSTLRQLTTVSPNQPRIITKFDVAPKQAWGNAGDEPLQPTAVQRRLAEIIAGGGQFVLDPFTPGAAPGFTSGRSESDRESYWVPSTQGAAPLTESGEPSESFGHIRRISTFANQFSRVLANQDASYKPIACDPFTLTDSGDRVSVIDLNGSQGRVVFVFSGKGKQSRAQAGRGVDLVLPSGQAASVFLGEQSVAWCLLDVHLGGRDVLDLCTLNAFALVGSVLVCYGPAKSTGVVSVNGSALEATVPSGKSPDIIEHEGMTVVVCNEKHVDNCHVTEDAVFLNVLGVLSDGDAVPVTGATSFTRIEKSGLVSDIKIPAAERTASGSNKNISLPKWSLAGTDAYVAGTSPRYASIEGPDTLDSLGVPFGYGWYRIELKSSASKKATLLAPELEDRMHLFVDAHDEGVFGAGPGGGDARIPFQLKKGKQTVVALVENLGRAAGGAEPGAPKGLFGHFYDTKAIKAGRAAFSEEDPINLLAFRSPLWEIRPGDVTSAARVGWTFQHRRKSPVFLTIEEPTGRGVIILNGEPIRWLDDASPKRHVFTTDDLKQGNNAFQIALIDELEEPAASRLKKIASSVSFEEGATAVTDKAAWSFAKWEAPPNSAFKAVPKGTVPKSKGPSWWKSTFETPESDHPIEIDMTGMTKGQIFLNGKHLTRFFTATQTGKAVGPQNVFRLPNSWLREDLPNELLIFDEHGGHPNKIKLTLRGSAHPIRSK